MHRKENEHIPYHIASLPIQSIANKFDHITKSSFAAKIVLSYFHLSHYTNGEMAFPCNSFLESRTLHIFTLTILVMQHFSIIISYNFLSHLVSFTSICNRKFISCWRYRNCITAQLLHSKLCNYYTIANIEEENFSGNEWRIRRIPMQSLLCSSRNVFYYN